MSNNTARTLSEDDIYRTSSQYRVWSFSPERLAALRRTTHELAVEQMTAHREHDQGSLNGGQITYLSEEEELRLVQRYCEQIRITSDHLKWGANVKATAVQYLRRFYVSNSVMTYPPKEIYKTALFLASKTEATHMMLSDYTRRISSKPDDILAPEYKLMQALRFTLDVRQPYRGLKGVLMELLNMVDGLPDMEVRDALFGLESPGKESTSTWVPPENDKLDTRSIQDRIHGAYSGARNTLDKEALLTDVYFLYTPSQIMFAALMRADSRLADFYISTKIPADSTIKPRIVASLRACCDILTAASSTPVLTKDERAAMEEKLEQCRDPNTRDLAKAHQAKKAGDPDEDKAKRKQLERERQEKEGHDLFGPALSINGTKGRG